MRFLVGLYSAYAVLAAVGTACSIWMIFHLPVYHLAPGFAFYYVMLTIFWIGYGIWCLRNVQRVTKAA